MFQDEARFGRMVRIKRCWAPIPHRPVVDNGYERQFTYVYGAVSPREGELDWKICTEMNTTRMSEFLTQVSAAHPRDLIIMILDGASSHKAKELAIPRKHIPHVVGAASCRDQCALERRRGVNPLLQMPAVTMARSMRNMGGQLRPNRQNGGERSSCHGCLECRFDPFRRRWPERHLTSCAPRNRFLASAVKKS
jgi:hypothetical protein